MNKTRSTKANESRSPLSNKFVLSEISVWFEPLRPFCLTQSTTRSMSSFSATAFTRGLLQATAFEAPRDQSSGSNSTAIRRAGRSEEHTSELQSRGHLVCRLLLEKKK